MIKKQYVIQLNSDEYFTYTTPSNVANDMLQAEIFNKFFEAKKLIPLLVEKYPAVRVVEYKDTI